MTDRVDFYRPGEDAAREPFHYTACGLDYVYLLNGVVREDDIDYGELITVTSQDELHKAICAHIIEKSAMSGEEFKFLRKFMGLTQEQLAEELQVDVQTVANYEKKGLIPKPSQKLMRWYAALFLLPSETKVGVMKSLIAPEREPGKKGAAFQRERQRIIPHWHERAQVTAC